MMMMMEYYYDILMRIDFWIDYDVILHYLLTKYFLKQYFRFWEHLQLMANIDPFITVSHVFNLKELLSIYLLKIIFNS